MKKTYQEHEYTQDQLKAISHYRHKFSNLAEMLSDDLVGSRETSLAQTYLEDAMMWAIKSIFVNGLKDDQ